MIQKSSLEKQESPNANNPEDAVSGPESNLIRKWLRKRDSDLVDLKIDVFDVLYSE